MNSRLLLTLTSPLLLLTLAPLAAQDTLVAQPPIELTGTKGRFDFIKVDAAQHRLLLSHTGNDSLDVFDVTTSKLIKSIPTGAAQGVAIDEKGGRYFVSVSKPPKMVIIDSAKLEVTGEVPLSAPSDLIAYHPQSNRVFVCNDDKPELWIIDPEAKTIVTTLTVPDKGMEDLGFDSQGKFLFQCLKDSSLLAQIDPQGKVVTTWSTKPAESPHGLAIIPDSDNVLVVGGNGKLVLMSLTTGQVTASCDVSPRIDEIAYDPGTKLAYGASGTGVISVVKVEPAKLTPLAPLTSSPGTHSIAIDPQTHTVWIAFATKDGKPSVQSFTAK